MLAYIATVFIDLLPRVGAGMPLMVSISGVRGIIGESLTPEVVVKYAAAFGQYCKTQPVGKPTVIVGQDGRFTGAMLSDLVCSTLNAMGVDVRYLGISPTPTVQLAVEHDHAAGGISVTASHNSIEWNGMKFIASTGMFLDGAENNALRALADRSPAYSRWDSIGALRSDNSWIRRHIEKVLRLPFLQPEVIRARKFKIVLDCINAAGGVIVPALLESLGCTVIPINCEVSGHFRHTPEPLPENLTDLAQRVKAEKADLGIAVDPDVDRLVFITEEGKPYSEEYTIASVVKFILEKHRSLPVDQRRVVVNLSTTRAVDDIARSYGSEVTRTPVGEINVAKAMKQLGAIVGGEGSGGVILPSIHLGRDAIVGIGLVLQQLAEFRGTLSQLKATLPRYAIAKGKIALGGALPDAVLSAIAAAQTGKAVVNTQDGVKLDFPEYWVHVRKSNTEPILRVIAEGKTIEDASVVLNDFTEEIAASLR